MAVLAAGVSPWAVVVAGGTPTLVFSFGLATLDPPGLVTAYGYFFRFTAGLPPFLLAYGVAILLYVAAVASAGVAVLGGEDARVTAALLVLSAASQAWVALGFARRRRSLVVPVGAVLLAALVWRWYLPLVRRSGSPP